jgi:hypothetical protein
MDTWQIIMIKKEKNSGQKGFLLSESADRQDKIHGLYRLARVVSRQYFENDFKSFNRFDSGISALLIGLMVSLLIIKQKPTER